MQKELAQEQFTNVSAEVCEVLMRDGFKAPFWVEVDDDRGLGFLCGFRMDRGKASEWSIRPAIEKSDFPVAMKVTDRTGAHLKVWLREHSWQFASKRSSSYEIACDVTAAGSGGLGRSSPSGPLARPSAH